MISVEDTLVRAALKDPEAGRICRCWLSDDSWLQRAEPRLMSYFACLASEWRIDNTLVRGLRKYQWARNNKLESLLRRAREGLENQGIESIALTDFGSQPVRQGLYPIRNAALLVAPSDRHKAFALLERQGLRGDKPTPWSDLRPGIDLRSEGQTLRLCWHAYSQARWPEADAGLRARACRGVLNHDDAVLLRLLEGAREQDRWWLIELAWLLQKQPPDWNRIASQAADWRRVLLLNEQLEQAACLGINVPVGPARSAVGSIERLDNWARSRRYDRLSYYLQRCSNSWPAVVGGLPRYFVLWLRTRVLNKLQAYTRLA